MINRENNPSSLESSGSAKFEELRARAEEHLKTSPAQPNEAAGGDLLHLIQELEVHQAELEIQNEELRKAQETVVQAQEELQAERNKYLDLFELAPVGYLTLDSQGLIQEINLAAAEMLGQERRMLSRSGLSRFLSPEHASLLASMRKQSLDSGPMLPVDININRNDGSVLNVQADVEPTKDVDGPSGFTRLILTDVTQLKKAEMAASHARDEWEATFDALPDMVCIIDNDYRIMRANRAMAKRFELHPRDLVGRHCFKLMHGLDHAPEFCPHRSLLTSKETCSAEIHEDHLQGDFLVTVAPLLHKDCSIRGSVHVARDVTVQKRQDNLLRQAQKMEALGTLAGGIAHDFNNLLAAIMGYSELAQDDVPKDSSVRQDLAYIIQAANKGKFLIRQILAFSRKVEVDRKPLLLNQAVNDAEIILRRTVPKMVSLELDLDADLRTIRADSAQMEQMVINLVANGADAITVQGQVSITTRNVKKEHQTCELCGQAFWGEYVQLSVKDNGCGMTPEVRARIFEPFFTTKGVGKGTGMGLSTVYGIVNSHGGHISCRSQEGLGTDFNIYLPVLGKGPLERFLEDPMPKDALAGEGTILVTDDEGNLRDIAQRILSKGGYKVLLADSGEEALKIYEANIGAIDGVILDLGMPGIGGIACLPKILKLDPKAKVLIASGYIDINLGEELTSLGAAGLLSKPYRKNELLKRVREMITY